MFTFYMAPSFDRFFYFAVLLLKLSATLSPSSQACSDHSNLLHLVTSFIILTSNVIYLLI